MTLLEITKKAVVDFGFALQNGVTLKRKEMMWQHIVIGIADLVIVVGGNGRSVGQVKKRWKYMKSAVRSKTVG